MRDVDENEQATARDELSQGIALKAYERERDKQIAIQKQATASRQPWVISHITAPDSPHLIVRCLDDKRCEFSPGFVSLVPKERALYLLLHVPPVVELATPEELKRDRELIREIEARRKRWNQMGGPQPAPFRLVVRFVRPGKNSHGNTCEPGEVWEVGEEDAYGLLRELEGKSPVGVLATDDELKAYKGSLGVGLDASERPDQPATGSKAKPVKSKKSTLPGAADFKLQKALRTYHKYSDVSCLNYDPIGSNALARLAEVGRGSATNFFVKYFGGYPAYLKVCHLERPPAVKIALLERDFSALREVSLPEET